MPELPTTALLCLGATTDPYEGDLSTSTVVPGQSIQGPRDDALVTDGLGPLEQGEAGQRVTSVPGEGRAGQHEVEMLHAI